MIEQRYHAIDKLRASMILTVSFGHAMLPYVTWPRRFKDPVTSIGFDVVGVLLYSFAMDLFFLTAGFSAALLLAKRGVRSLLKNRMQRILLPFLLAWVILAPLTRAAYKSARNIAESGSLQAGLDVLTSWSWLTWSKIYHLWFLPALVFLTLLGIVLRFLVVRFTPQLGQQIDIAARRLLCSKWRAAWLVLIAGIPTMTSYLFPHGSAGNVWFAGFAMILFFFIGWFLFRHRDLLDTMDDQCAWLFSIAALALPMTVWAVRIRMFEGAAADPLIGLVAGIGNTILVACLTFALLQLFQVRFNQPSRTWRYISDASYWIFLLHFPIVIGVSGILSVTTFPAAIKYLITVTIAAAIILPTYELVARRTMLAPPSCPSKGQTSSP